MPRHVSDPLSTQTLSGSGVQSPVSGLRTLWTDGVHRAREAVRQQVRDYETAQADYERFDRETKTAEQEAEERPMEWSL